METAALVFRPRPIWLGLVSCLALALGVGLPLLLVVAPARSGGTSSISLILGGVIVCAMLFFAAILPTMRYVVTATDLVLHCGPFSWTIPIASIQLISEADLGFLPWSDGLKLPGYSLFTIRYSDAGAVRMCATAVTSRIVLLKAEGHLWGVTPADVPAFVSAIGARRGS